MGSRASPLIPRKLSLVQGLRSGLIQAWEMRGRCRGISHIHASDSELFSELFPIDFLILPALCGRWKLRSREVI